MKMSVLRPGLLVSLKTSIKGGVNYQRVDLEPEHVDATGASVAKWETLREIPDPAEYERAVVARSAARAQITAVCSASSFGLLCPVHRESDLAAAIDAAREITDRHNAGAACTHVDVYALVGRIAQDDAEAARAISAEVRELLETMQQGIAAADPAAIREAATKARALGQMLSADVAGKVSQAIDQARGAAREIVRRVEKAGEAAAVVVGELATQRIEAARFAFLDLDEGGEVGAAPVDAPARGGIDLEPAAVGVVAMYAAVQPGLEF